MKNILTALCALLAYCTASAQDNFRICGTFTDAKKDTMTVGFVKWEPDKEIVNLQVPINDNGEFEFDCQIKNAYEARLTLKSGSKENYIFIVPNEKAVIRGSFTKAHDWEIDGSTYYQQLAKVMEIKRPYLKEYDRAREAYEQGIAMGGDESALKAQRGKANADINQRLGEMAMDYIRQHPDEDATVAFVGDGTFMRMAEEMNLLAPEVRNGRFKKILDAYQRMVERAKKEQKAAQSVKKEIVEGQIAPDFTLKDIDGKTFTLSSLYNKGKYVIVDFWGSWCSWCIKGFPKMKAYADKYKDRLEIVGVDSYDKEDKWKAAVEKNHVTWRQVCSTDGTTEVRFGVEGYPFKVLIAPDGRVLKITTGEGEAFYKTLDEVMK